MISAEEREFDFHVLELLIKEGVLENTNPQQLCAEGEFVCFHCADEKDINEQDRRYLERAGLDTKPGALNCIQPLGGVFWLSKESPLYAGCNAEETQAIVKHYHVQLILARKLTKRKRGPFRNHYPCKAGDEFRIAIMHGIALNFDGIENYRRSTEHGIKPLPGYHVHWDESHMMHTFHLRLRRFNELVREFVRGRSNRDDFFRSPEEFQEADRILNKWRSS